MKYVLQMGLALVLCGIGVTAMNYFVADIRPAIWTGWGTLSVWQQGIIAPFAFVAFLVVYAVWIAITAAPLFVLVRWLAADERSEAFD